MLRIILGPSDSGKTEYIYNEIENRMKDGKFSWILTPEQFSLFTEKEILGRFGICAQTNVKVLSFSGLCNLVFGLVGPLRMKYIDGAGKQIAAAQVMQILDGRLKTLGRNLKQNGFAKTLAETVSEFKRYGIPPEALRFASENTDNEELSDKLLDLAAVYEEYNRIIEQRSADAEDNLSLICPKLEKCGFLSGTMYIMHFRSFTPTEHRAIGRLMHCMDIVFAANYSSSPAFGSLFYPVGTTVNILKHTAETEGIEIGSTTELEPKHRGGELEYLREKYFDYRAEPYNENSGKICICSVQNRYREVELAADLILKLCRTEGRRFGDFLILARNSGAYNKILPAVFNRRGIHVFADHGRPILTKPLMRLICGTLDILAHGISYERIMRIAGADMSGTDRDDIDMLENYILAVAPTHAMWQSTEWTYCPDTAVYDMERINSAKNTLLSGIEYIKDRISGTKTGGVIADTVIEWLKTGGAADRTSELISRYIAQDKRETAEEYRQVWNTAISVLAQMADIMRDTDMTYRQFAGVFENACRGIEFNMTPQTLDGVMFSQIDKFRSSGSDVVIVLGMNEGIFPMGHSTEGFISDSERISMAALGVELAPGAESRRREEQLLIYAVLSAAKEKLYLVQSLEGSDGTPLQSSEIIKRTEELFPNAARYNPNEESDGFSGAEGAAAMFERLSETLAVYGGRAELMPLPMRELYAWFDNNDEYKNMLRSICAVIDGDEPERISKETAAALYGQPLSLSASQIETYNSCAFRYFLTYGLFTKEREKAGIEPKSAGSIQHGALYGYFSELKKRGTDPDEIGKEECFRDVSEAVDAEARRNSELLYESSAYYKYVVMRMKGIVSQTAWEVLKFYKSSRFRPYGFEIKIASNGDIPVMTVKDTDGRTIAGIRGSIDRADTAELDGSTLVSVIDYKSSAKGLDVKLAEDGITIQPLLYTSALCGSIKNAVPAAMVYMPMTDPIIKEEDYNKKGQEAAVNQEMRPNGWIADDEKILSAYAEKADKRQGSFIPSGGGAVVSRQELKMRIDRANKKIRESALEITQGNIKAEPYKLKNKHDACQYCLYGGICKNEG